MEDYKAKQRIRKKIYSPWVFGSLLLVTLFLIKGTWGVYFKQNESAKNLEKVKTELANAQNREEDLEASVSYLKTQEGVEEEIRDKYSVAKPGEEILLIVEPRDNGKSDEHIRKSWREKIGAWFSNLFN